MSHQRVMLTRKRKRTVLKEKIYLTTLTILIILICSLVFGGFFTTAHGNVQEEPVDYRYYKSIEVTQGDTLWDIAQEYLPNDSASLQNYIDELKEINHLSSDDIQDGHYITVAYNDTTFR